MDSEEYRMWQGVMARQEEMIRLLKLMTPPKATIPKYHHEDKEEMKATQEEME